VVDTVLEHYKVCLVSLVEPHHLSTGQLTNISRELSGVCPPSPGRVVDPGDLPLNLSRVHQTRLGEEPLHLLPVLDMHHGGEGDQAGAAVSGVERPVAVLHQVKGSQG